MRIAIFNASGLQTISVEHLHDIHLQANDVLWVDIAGPNPATMSQVQERFGFHPLAVEDTINQRQRPKVDEYDDHIFIITNHISMPDHALEFDELDIFLGRDYIVTTHDSCHHLIEEARRRLARFNTLKLYSSEFLFYVIIDTVIDAYFPVLDKVDDELEDISEAVINNPNRELLERLLALRRMLSEMWHVVEQQQSMFSVLTRHEHDLLIHHDVLEYYLRDVHDHLIRITNITNILRDNLTAIIELYMSSESYRLNRVVNRLTVITIIIGIFTVFGGIYGMNFELTWPPFQAEWGVPFILTLMLLLSSATILLFRKMRWL